MWSPRFDKRRPQRLLEEPPNVTRKMRGLDSGGAIWSIGRAARFPCASHSHGSQSLAFPVSLCIPRCGSGTFVEWTQFMPEAERPSRVSNVLDRYRFVATDQPSEENTFKFNRMESRFRPPKASVRLRSRWPRTSPLPKVRFVISARSALAVSIKSW
jgi:hypothetical protein